MTKNMDGNLDSGFEAAFRDEDDSLAGFYNADSKSLQEEEEDLYPILSSVSSDVDRYEKIGLLAEGGEKRITQVLDRRLNRHVAMAQPIHCETKEQQEQFLREAYLEANLTHPNIMPIHNVGVDEDHIPFFTMELVSDDSLKSILDKLRNKDEEYSRRYSLENRLNIFLKVCDAIAYAHFRNVLHLDIKPSNIRVGEFGEVFVCDWGIARVLFDGNPTSVDMQGKLNGDVINDLTLSGVIKGTPGFMAPEQTVSKGEKSKQTDIYALGAMLYTLLTLELPVRGTSGNEIVQNTRDGKVVPLHRRVSEQYVPVSLAAVAMKALAFDPKERYADVRDLQQEINCYLSGYPTRSERAGLLTRFSLFMKRHSRIASVLMFSLLLLAVVVSVDLTAIRKGKAAAEAAQYEAETNLELYLEEQREVVQLNSDLHDAITVTMKSPGFLSTVLTLRVLDQALNKAPDPNQYRVLMLQKGIMHFMRREFNEARRCFGEAGDQTRPINELFALSRKYAEIYPDDEVMLSCRQMAELIGDYKVKSPRMTLIINYMYLNYIRQNPPGTPEEYLPLALAMLDHLNNLPQGRNQLKLVQNTNGYHLNLSGLPYRKYTLKLDAAYNQNVLAPLKLYSLDISQTPLLSAGELSGLKLKELNMQGLSIPNHNLPFILGELDLQKLIINADAFPRDTMRRLYQKFDVTEQ